MNKLFRILMPLMVVSSLLSPILAEPTPRLYDTGERADPNLIAPYPTTGPVSGSIFQGQEHNYSVIFRGNGEAIVYANIEFTNTTDNAINQFVFTAPVEIKDLTIYQYKTNICGYGYIYNGHGRTCMPYKSAGIAYDEYYSYMPTQNQYIKAKFVAEGNKIVINLPIEIDPETNGHLLLGYTTKLYANEFWGAFSYKFTTLAVEQRVEKVHIGINVDSDLILKGASSTVNYATDVKMSTSVASESYAVPNQDYDNLINNLMYSGAINKTFSGLATGETVDVNGEYAENTFRLYAKEITITIVIVVLVVIAIALLVRKLSKNKKRGGDDVTASRNNSITSKSFVIDVLIGLIGAIATIALSMGLIAMSYYGGYGYYGYGYLSSVMSMIIGILIVLVYGVFLLLGPAIRGTKYGWKAFLTVLISEIVFVAIIGLFIWVIVVAQMPYDRVYPV